MSLVESGLDIEQTPLTPLPKKYKWSRPFRAFWRWASTPDTILPQEPELITLPQENQAKRFGNFIHDYLGVPYNKNKLKKSLKMLTDI